MLAAVTLFASCSQEEIVTKTDGESLVSFTVTTPELGSRAAEEATTPAIGTGATATDLYFVVYDETIGEQVTTISSKDAKYTDFKGKKATINLPLLNGHQYSLLFWAVAPNETGAYEINWETKSINLKNASALVSNNENYDAFYAYVEPFTVTGTKTSSVELKRPFAQLNIGTTTTDLTNVKKYYNADFAQSTIVVKTATSMDLTNGKVSVEKELTYAAADFIASEKMKNTYEYLSMNYLLVSNEKNLVDVKFSVNEKEENGKVISKTFNNVPVQRNYKTNIYGDLFTSTTTWNVELKPGFDAEIEPANELAALFAKGGKVTLYTDVTLTEPLILTGGKEVTINLNGNTITGGLFTEADGDINEGNTDSYPFWVQDGVLNIIGEGNVVAQNCDYSMAVYATGGTVNIYGGYFTTPGISSDLIYASGTGEGAAAKGAIINIYGGVFKANKKVEGEDGTENEYCALNIKDYYRGGTAAGKETITDETKFAEINVYGGTFYKFNPAANLSEGANTDFVEEGYSSVQVGDNFVVCKNVTSADFATAINNAEVSAVKLTEDVAISSVLPLNKDLTIVLNEKTLDASANASRPFELKGGNLTIIGDDKSTVKVGKYGLVNVLGENPSEVVLDGGKYYGDTDKGSFLKPRGKSKTTFTLNNVTYVDDSTNGWVIDASSFEGEDLKIQIDGGSFKAGAGIAGLPSGSYIKNATIENTYPGDDYHWNAVDIGGDGAILENCTIISNYYAVSIGYGFKGTVKNCNVTSAKYAYIVFPTGGEINVVGGSYTGELFIYDLYADAAPAKIIINGKTEAQK